MIAKRLLLALLFTSLCLPMAYAGGPQPPAVGPSIAGPDVAPGAPLKLVAYGDIRFTDPKNTTATNPRVRQFLVDKVAAEKPRAILLTGDLPFRGANAADWQVYRQETAIWKQGGILLYSTIGNHEIRGGFAQGIANYSKNFPQLHGYLYYSVQMGSVYVISLDSTQSYAKGSPQRTWLVSQLEHLPKSVDFVFILDHMPLMADLQTEMIASLPGKPEIRLRSLLEAEAEKSNAKFAVISGHIHNYERFEHGGITYIISGGGGAKAYPVLVAGDEDLYRGRRPINYNYVVIRVNGKRAEATMYRVTNPAAPKLTVEPADTFLLKAK